MISSFVFFWCPFATFSLRHFPLANSEDAVKNHFGFAGKLHCVYKMYLSSERLLIRIAFMCNFVHYILGDLFLFSHIVCQPSIQFQGSLFVHATDLRDSSTLSPSSRNNPIDICLISINFLTRELTFLAQSFVFRDRQKETTAIASI